MIKLWKNTKRWVSHIWRRIRLVMFVDYVHWYLPFTDRSLNSRKTSFQFSVKTARWLSTNGLRLFLQFYYSKTPVYDLPPGWFPYPVEWILSFPRAPLGTVSIQVWGSACATAISLTGETISTALQHTGGQTNGRKEAQSFPAGEKSEAAKQWWDCGMKTFLKMTWWRKFRVGKECY